MWLFAKFVLKAIVVSKIETSPAIDGGEGQCLRYPKRATEDAFCWVSMDPGAKNTLG
jgi:hypothetical protein